MATNFIKVYTDFVALGGYRLVSPLAVGVYQRLTKNLWRFSRDKTIDSLLKQNKLVSKTTIYAVAKSLGCDRKTVKAQLKILKFWGVIKEYICTDYSKTVPVTRFAYELGTKFKELKLRFDWNLYKFQLDFIKSCQDGTATVEYFSKLRLLESMTRIKKNIKKEDVIDNPIREVIPGGKTLIKEKDKCVGAERYGG